MARIHVLQAAGAPNTYTVVVHAPTPAGNNAAGVAWSDAIKGSGMAATMLPIGTSAGQITNAEANNVANGTVIEGSFAWQDDPAWDNTQRIADVELRATQLIAELTAQMQTRLKFFGYTRT